MNSNKLESFDLHKLAQACADQEALFRKQGRDASDPRFCYELFRRAVLLRDEAAWSLVYEQYESQVIHWVRQSPVFQSTQQTADYFVNEAFAKFWHAVSSQTFRKHLKTLGAVLLYLKKCVASTLYNYQRTMKRESMYCALDKFVEDSNPSATHSVECELLEGMAGEQLWQLIKSLLKDERELAAMENFTLGKKARHIQADYAQLFPDAKSIYRTKENVLKRLRRNSELKTWQVHGGKQAV
jgi:hypothetical protein